MLAGDCMIDALTWIVLWDSASGCVHFYEKSFSRQMPRIQMSWRTLEKSGLEPAAPIRLADRTHCALPTQPNPHIQK